MSNEDPEVATFEWTPPGTIPPQSAGGAQPHVVGDLADEILTTVENRGLPSSELVRRVARDTMAWLHGESCPDAGVAALLFTHELALFREAHGWRGPVARFLGALAEIARITADDGGPTLRESLAGECALWLEMSPERLPDRGRCAAVLLDADPYSPAAGLESSETILIHGWSETVARGVELAHARGILPSIIVSEGGPDLGGRRLARRLVASGLDVRFVYDAALVDAVDRADRIWLGTEAISQRSFSGRVGTRALLERAQELDVPRAVIATTDKILPTGEVTMPTWAAEESWHLWEGAPDGVIVESQSFERVPLGLVSAFATNAGLFGALELARYVEAGAAPPEAAPSLR